MSSKITGERRKIQLTGGSTYIVSLPKRWVTQMGMGKGSHVLMNQTDDITLCLKPEGAEKDEGPRRAVINVSDGINPDNVVRRVVTAYIDGYSIIQIRNPLKRIALAQKLAVTDITRRKLIGTEVLSDLPQELALQVLLGRSELSVTDALWRMSVIAASMHREAMSALGSDDTQLAREIVARDDEVDRFWFYTVKLLNGATAEPYSIKEIGRARAPGHLRKDRGVGSDLKPISRRQTLRCTL